MYRCEACERISEPGDRCNRLVVETEAIAYPRRAKIYWRPPKDGEKGKWVEDPGGTGTRIVREINACAECVAKQLALERSTRAAAA